MLEVNPALKSLGASILHLLSDLRSRSSTRRPKAAEETARTADVLLRTECVLHLATPTKLIRVPFATTPPPSRFEARKKRRDAGMGLWLGRLTMALVFTLLPGTPGKAWRVASRIAG